MEELLLAMNLEVIIKEAGEKIQLQDLHLSGVTQIQIVREHRVHGLIATTPAQVAAAVVPTRSSTPAQEVQALHQSVASLVEVAVAAVVQAVALQE